jgi:hypothetical protein
VTSVTDRLCKLCRFNVKSCPPAKAVNPRRACERDDAAEAAEDAEDPRAGSFIYLHVILADRDRVPMPVHETAAGNVSVPSMENRISYGRIFNSSCIGEALKK